MVSWLPANEAEGDPALWHVVHPDGDEEDLEEAEVLEGIVKLQEAEGNGASGAGTAEDSSNAEAPELKDDKDRTSDRDVDSTDKKEEVVEAPKEDISTAIATTALSKEEPSIVRNGTSIVKAYSRKDRDRERDKQVGLAGFKNEILRIYELMSDPLKRLGNKGFDRDTRKQWESSVRSSEAAVELVGPLLQLEALVRAVQTLPEVREQQESLISLVKESKVQRMRGQGWTFGTQPNILLSILKQYGEIPEESVAAIRGLIGKHARRFNPKTEEISDGQIVGYLSPLKAANIAAKQIDKTSSNSNDEEGKGEDKAGGVSSNEEFFLVHFNGQSEVLDRAAAQEAVRLKAEDVIDVPMSPSVSKKENAASSAAPVAEDHAGKKDGRQTTSSTGAEEEEEEWDEDEQSDSDSDDSEDSGFSSAKKRRSARSKQTSHSGRSNPNLAANIEDNLAVIFSSTLWPSAEARSRWISAVQASKTVAELSFGLSAFTAQASSFGAMGLDQEAAERLAAARQQQRFILAARKTESSRSEQQAAQDERDRDPDLGTRASRRATRQPVQYTDNSNSSSRSKRQKEEDGRDSRGRGRKRGREPSPPSNAERGFLRRAAALKVVSYAE